MTWAKRWLRTREGTGYVYEVQLDAPIEVDTNLHSEGADGPFDCVRAPSGRVLRLLDSEEVAHRRRICHHNHRYKRLY